ncbi:Ig heavy chain Mem5-like, partial [Polyodon spathula]|uniref:Ig heavy chain Mem5-like n=1 Tax=Polyodon spathula TaxID=7913 RepID=UPI001B7E8A33
SDGLAEPVVPPLHIAEPGGNITLKCSADTSNAYYYAVTWYRQEPDGRIQIVTSLSSGYLKDGRYSGTLDNKNGQYSLTIANLSRTDSAVYFCIARAAALLFAPGSSTKLVVSDPLTVPSVELYSPGLFDGDSDRTEPVPLLCLVRDTSPGRHRVLWTIGAEAAAPGSGEDGEIEPDGSYTLRSYLTISADQWSSGAVKCEVYNNSNVTENVSASHRRQDCVPVWFYALPVVLLLILVVVSVACVYRRLHKTESDHKPRDAPCRPQRAARLRTVQDYSTEYASLNL